MTQLNYLDQKLRQIADTISSDLNNGALDVWREREKNSSAALADALASQDDDISNRAWFLHKVAETRLAYVECFALMTNAQHYDAWCKLERVEIDLVSLKRNPFYDPKLFCTDALASLVAQWQGIFPYTVFFSPELVKKSKKCSICDATVGPWSGCGHEPGRVYGGRECYRIVQGVELLGISLVTDPVQKYSVAFLSNGGDGKPRDHYDYSLVKFIVDRLASPFDGWTTRWIEAYHPHSMFPGQQPEGGCPCGSGRKYSECCLAGPGVIRPHLDIVFDHEPTPSLPNGYLAGYGDRSCPAIVRSPTQTKK